MKKLFYQFAVIALIFFCAIPANVLAQDILDIAPLPVGNINTIINGDTLAGGVRANPDRIYRLERGSVYQVTEPIKVNGDLHIVAADGAGRPPVLAPAILADNSSIDHFFNLIGVGSDVTISNMYILSLRADGNSLGWSEGIRVNADNIALKLRGVIFDGFTSCALRVYASWSKLDVQDCNFRNLQHASAYFGGQAFLSDYKNHMDTCLFINNTFFACASYLWSIRGYDKYSRFEHNSVVYGIVNPFLVRQGYNLHVKNNIFYSAHALGGTPEQVRDTWFLNYPDTTVSGVIHVRIADSVVVAGTMTWVTGPEAHVDSAKGVFENMLLPENRIVNIHDNAYFFPQALSDFYQAYNDTVTTTDIRNGQPLKRTLTMPKFFTTYFETILANGRMASFSPNTNVYNNYSADPGFDANIAGHITEVINYVHKVPTNKLDVPWYYQFNYPPAWPLPENLAYSNATMQSAGSDGFALGDLNWFPAQKAGWVLGVDSDNSTIPEKFELKNNYPNPFNPSTTIEFALPAAKHVTLTVYNVLGQTVKVLVNQNLNAGTHRVNFDASSLTSGVYVYQLSTDNQVVAKKMMLLK